MLDMNFMETPLVNETTWEKYLNEEGLFTRGFCGYVSATEEIVEYLENLNEKCDSFESLKAELTSLIKERKGFTTYAVIHYP